MFKKSAQTKPKARKKSLFENLFRKKVLDLPKFEIFLEKNHKPLPSVDFLRKSKVIYPLIKPFAYASISFEPALNSVEYRIVEPGLDPEDNRIMEKIKEGLIQIVNVSLESVKKREAVIEFLEENVRKLIDEYGFELRKEQYLKIMYYIYRDFIGLNEIEPLMQDPYIEDVGCDGNNINVYVIHQKYGSVRTNIIYKDDKKLREFVTKLAERCDRYISYAEPLLDGTLPDGTRVHASIASDVTTRGPVFSLRKFRETPFTPVDLVSLGTVSTEMLAYLWFLVENGRNILITGGVATGKTSLLNCISIFIPNEAKIVSIEDSVAGDSNILVKAGSRIKNMKISDLVDEMIRKYGEDENHAKNPERIEVMALDGNYKIEFRKPNSFIRHEVEKDMYLITTCTGKRIKVTEDHSLFALGDDGSIITITPKQVRNRKDFIATPRFLPFEGNEIRKINLLDYLSCFNGDFIVGEPVRKIFSRFNYDVFSSFGVGYKKYQWWKRNGMIGTAVMNSLLNSMEFTKEELSKLEIAGKRRGVRIPVMFEISDDFLTMIGLWIGDGSYDKHNKNRVVITNVDKECIELIESVAASLGVNISKMSDGASFSLNSTLLYKLMKNVLCLRGHSSERRIPDFVQNISNRQLGLVLKGYFSADGSMKKNEVSCSSQSLDLLNDIQTILLRFGIISRIQLYKRKDRCYELSISSNENTAKFSGLGFLQERKNEKLLSLASQKSHHTVSDVIPLGNGLLEEISKFRKLCWPYHQGMQNIGKTYLERIVDDVECDSDVLIRLAKSHIFWDKIKKVRKLPRKKIYVYDLSIPGNENFICSNIIMHNTRELNLPHENWIPDVSRSGFTTSGAGEVTMFQLLKESFRQNPDYLIVGEVRGKETYILFQGMSSIPGNENILVVNDSNLKRIPIGDLNVKPDFRIPVLDMESKKIRLISNFKKIEHAPRSELYKITTKKGRSIVTTADHSLFSWDNEIITKPTKEFRKDDIIVIPGMLPSGFNDIKNIDVSELEGIRIFAPELIRKAVKKLGYDRCSSICSLKGVSDYYANFTTNKPSALNAKKFKKLMTEAKIEYDIKDMIVRFDRKSESMQALLNITPEFLRLLGYFISEGSLNITKCGRISLYSKNEEILDDMRKCITVVTNKTPKERITYGFGSSTELSFNHKVIYEFLRQHIGQKSSEKKAPDFVFGLSKEKIGYFLSGLYSGDGTLTKNAFGYYTISRQLASDVANLLLTLGVVATIGTRQRSGRKTTDYEVLFYTSNEKKEFLKYVNPIRKIPNIRKPANNKNKIGDIYLDRIKSIEKIVLKESVPVYDLSVDSHQNFIGGFGSVLLHNSGHPSMSTFHSGGVEDLIKRLQTKPISLSAGLLESLDVVITMVHAQEKSKSARRVKEVVEIESIDSVTGAPRTNKVFAWRPSSDAYEYRGNSWVLSKISSEKGISMQHIFKDIMKRKELLDWMCSKSATSMEEVVNYLKLYKSDPARMERMTAQQ